MPMQLTGGAGYKAHPTYEKVMPAGIRRASAAFREMENDRNLSEQASRDQTGSANAEGGTRKQSVAIGGAVSGIQSERRGSVLVASSATRRESMFGLEATAGQTMDPNRRPSTSLASDLYHKVKGK